MRFACGYLSPYFVTDPERMEVALENRYIPVHERRSDQSYLEKKTEKKLEVFTCRICDKPLCLETDTNTDEDGRAVHEECYLKHIAAPRPDNAMTE